MTDPADHPDRGGPISQLQYLVLMGLCLLVTVPLEVVLGARVYRRLRILVLALIPTVLVFSVWDIVGIAWGHWTYNPRFVTGIRLPFAMPLEELVFFLVVPICGLLSYEAVGQVLSRGRRIVGNRRGTGPVDEQRRSR